MSIYGSWVDATISAGTSKTSAIDLGMDYDYLEVMIPEMDSCELYMQVSEQEDNEDFPYYDLGKDTTTDNETFSRADVWRLGGHRFIKIVATASQTVARAIRVRGMRY